MIIDYAHFGDIVSFDTTFRTNRQCRPLGVFAGFNHHRGCTIFGATLLYDETVESFKWLFEVFVEAHGGKKPITIFTDQDAAMTIALTDMWPQTWHGLCTWHLMQNGIKHLGNMMKDGSGFLKDIKKCIYQYDEEEQFDRAWSRLLSENGVMDNAWLRRMYTLRNKWHFERVLNQKRGNELKAKFESRNKLPQLANSMSIVQKQAEELYTPTIYAKFETDGLLCCHCLKVLDVLDIKRIPDSYILKRWTRGARTMVVNDNRGKEIEEDVNLDRTQRSYYTFEGYELMKDAANELRLKESISHMSSQASAVHQSQASAVHQSLDEDCI
ncbi:protein FAR1-RELATED SEQUENCE 5-like [Macadamia integrifolia]|uniref:protein FAR1-RELATED SEQUENCE 5-like n=1 Tax=Macadamia integrifolia TaxID=60698 RepID=UPI001C4F4C2A|nr:protein FAR1-RELATED SEQUENCE 5-like [Macadamia integrifolia]